MHACMYVSTYVRIITIPLLCLWCIRACFNCPFFPLILGSFSLLLFLSELLLRTQFIGMAQAASGRKLLVPWFSLYLSGLTLLHLLKPKEIGNVLTK